ncbi:MAG: helix-turn-helix domain-containing protein, partial [Nitrospirales bacterium]
TMRKPFLAAIRQCQRQHEPGVLIGVRNICDYTQIGPRTFYRWCREHEFPATLTPGGRWITSKQLIDNWIVHDGKPSEIPSKRNEKLSSLAQAMGGLVNEQATHPESVDFGSRGSGLYGAVTPYHLHNGQPEAYPLCEGRAVGQV